MSFIVGADGGYFTGSLEKILGDGQLTRFWDDLWAGNGLLKSKFPRLFRLCSDKEKTMSNMEGWNELN